MSTMNRFLGLPRREGRCRAACLVAAALAGSVSLAPVAAQQTFQVVVSVGQGTFRIDVPVGPAPADKVFEESSGAAISLNVVFLGGTDLFGLFSYAAEGNFDPYFAARLSLTNVTDTAQSVGLFIGMPMQPVPASAADPAASFIGLATAEVKDANGDGSASYAGGGPGLLLTDAAAGRPMTPPHDVQLGAGPATTLFDVGPTPVPVSPSGQWSFMNFVHFGLFPKLSSLSAGDSVEFYVFGCVALPATACPDPPALNLAAIPEPGAGALMASGLALLAAAVRRRRSRT